jgi:hypothetical protein
MIHSDSPFAPGSEGRVVRGGLCRERYGSRSGERAGGLGDDRQVRVQPGPVRCTEPERSERPPFLRGPSSLAEARYVRERSSGESRAAKARVPCSQVAAF